MTNFAYYLQCISELCEGTRPAPDGITLHGGDAQTRMEELQQQILQLGADEFLQRCAAHDHITITGDPYDGMDSAQMRELLLQLQPQAAEAETPMPDDAPAAAPEDDGRPQIEEPDGPRSACEVLIDCCLLDDKLFAYLADVLKRQDVAGFVQLAQVTTRTGLRPEDFLLWLATKEYSAPETEQACVAIMDTCLRRVQTEGQTELLAALLAGDEQTFTLFRCEAEELKHLPAATYEWYCENYLDKYYPVRFMLRTLGVPMPKRKEALSHDAP